MNAPALSPLLPIDTFFTLEPERTVAHATLGLTLYLDEPRRWANEWAREAFLSFAARVHPRWLTWITTSREARWRQVESADAIADELVSDALTGRVRHLLRVQVADDPGAPRVGFTYREVDPERTSALAYLQVHFPVECDPNELLAFAIEVGQRHAIHCGIGGYSYSWNAAAAFSAFRAIHLYTRRFLGVDVQHPEAAAWTASAGLPGVSWINLVGPKVAAAAGIDVAALATHPWEHDVTVMSLRGATLVRAGALPDTGDLNLMAYPSALAECARRLDEYTIEPPSFPGTFTENEDGKDKSADWFRRFVAPEHWP